MEKKIFKQPKYVLKNMVKNMTYVKVAETIDIPVGKMKHVEVDGIEIL